MALLCICLLPLSRNPGDLHSLGVCRAPRGDADGGLFPDPPSLLRVDRGAVGDSTTSRVRDVRQNRDWTTSAYALDVRSRAGHVAGMPKKIRAFAHRDRLLDQRDHL